MDEEHFSSHPTPRTNSVLIFLDELLKEPYTYINLDANKLIHIHTIL